MTPYRAGEEHYSFKKLHFIRRKKKIDLYSWVSTPIYEELWLSCKADAHCTLGRGKAQNGNTFQYSCLENPMDGGAWYAAVHGVTESQTWLSDFTFTFHFHALEKEMATHSSVLAWRIPGTGEPGGLPSMGSHRVRHDWSDLAAAAAAEHLQNYQLKQWKLILKYLLSYMSHFMDVILPETDWAYN